MKHLGGIRGADFLEVGAALLVPVVEVRRAVGLFRCARENDVGDFQVALRTAVGGGVGVDGLGQAEGAFAHLVAGAVVATDGRVHFALMHDDGIVADVWGVLVGGGIGTEQKGDDNEGILFSNEAAAGLHFGDLEAELGDGGLQLPVAVGAQAFDGKLLLGLFQPFFPPGEQRVGRGCLFRPGVAGEGLVVVRHKDVLIQRGHAVTVGAIGHHIHLGLDEQGLATGGRVGELQDGLAVEKIVTIKDAVQAGDVALDAVGLVFVELVVKAGDLGRGQHGVETGQELWQLGIDAGEFAEALIGLGHTDGELEFGLVGLRVFALQAGVGPLLRDEVRLDGDAVVEVGDVHLLAGDEVFRQGGWRGGYLHLADDFLHHFLDDFARHFHALFHLAGDHALLLGGGDDFLQCIFDLARKRREGQHQKDGDDDQQEQADELAKRIALGWLGLPGTGTALVHGGQGGIGALDHAGGKVKWILLNSALGEPPPQQGTQ